MRSTLIVSAFAALALAAPRPQDIDFTGVDSTPDPEVYSAPTNVTSEEVAIQPASAALAIASAAVTDVATTSDPVQEKRDLTDGLSARGGDCAALPAGSGPAVNNPDTPDAFTSYQPFLDVSNNAPVPQGYTQAFQGLFGSSQTTSYLGFTTLGSYDTVACQEYCDQLPNCISFNLYYERDPSQNPAAACSNPTSVTNIKCVRYGVQLNAATATNTGETRNPAFEVVIVGSNGYNKLAPPNSQPGFSGPMELDGAINAPNDPVTNTNTYMGTKFFTFDKIQSYEAGVEACTAACTAQTAYNSRHPPAAPAKPNVCNQVVVYVLSDNNQPQGVQCAMYSESWASNYATNLGQYRGSDYWSVTQAYAYTNATYAANYGNICAVGGCPTGSYRGGNCGGWGSGLC
ncbi:hypothetical protein V8E51_008242 [Hyaloscypha variabilis]